MLASMRTSSLETLQKNAISALRRYLGDGGTTEDLRAVAVAFVDSREHFFTREGDPDWLGRTHAYRRWVREVMSLANVPGETVATLQAAIRYHTGNILRERLDAETLEDLGLVSTSPRERSVEKRERTSSILNLFSGGAELTDADDVMEAIQLMAFTMRRMDLSNMTPGKRKAARSALEALCKRAEEVAG